ncbi:hypothetical protein [Streptomyces decoyicus]
METDGTTPPEGDKVKRQARHQRRLERRRWTLRQQHLPLGHGPLHRPMWQEPLRGALYATGGSVITLLTPWIQHWL